MENEWNKYTTQFEKYSAILNLIQTLAELNATIDKSLAYRLLKVIFKVETTWLL